MSNEIKKSKEWVPEKVFGDSYEKLVVKGSVDLPCDKTLQDVKLVIQTPSEGEYNEFINLKITSISVSKDFKIKSSFNADTSFNISQKIHCNELDSNLNCCKTGKSCPVVRDVEKTINVLIESLAKCYKKSCIVDGSAAFFEMNDKVIAGFKKIEN